jgi:signal transduction histidine kinase
MEQFAWVHMTALTDEHQAVRADWLRSRSGLLIIGMVLALAVIAGLSMWDVRRRHAESMEDFGQNQQRFARSLACNLETRLLLLAEQKSGGLQPALLGLAKLEQPGTSIVLVWPPDTPGFLATSGQSVARELLRDAVREGRGYVRLTRETAAELGLPRRAAVAGLSSFTDSDGRIFWVAAVATAIRARDREDEASWRALLAVVVAAGAVLALGGVALHWQRQELRTQQALALEEAHRRREAELERASRAATMGITHELSTPLGIIAARAEQLAAKLAGDDRAARGVQVIQEQASRMEQVIRGILTLVRNETPIADRLSPGDVCHGAMSLVRHRFAESGVELKIDANPDSVLPLLRGDQRLLEQSLVNLLLNACDACAPGKQVVLHIRASEQQVLFSVTDNGVGISEQAAARAMEPFFTTKPAGKGTGLGLAITHEIIKSHRGTLRIGPRPEGGTWAEISLPQAEENGNHGA